MRPFVVRLDPTSFDRAAASSPPGPDDLSRLTQTWNAWNGKVRGLLDQDSRIENLYWRRWHMEQRQGPVYHASPPLQQVNFPHDLSASVEAVERRRATEDLEAFLRNTLQAAQPGGQPELVHNPPTYDAFTQHASTSQPQPPPPIAQPAPQPPVIHAPQPQRLAFNPSPEWGYSSLPPVSRAPPAGTSSTPQSRIIATPSWTALIADPAAAANEVNNATSLAQPQPQQPAPSLPHLPGLNFPPFFHPQPGMPGDAYANALAGLPLGVPPANPVPPPIPSPSFTLPPTATLFSDLPSALSSAPPAATPPAFFSSYGMYQPVIAPYPRFLTPSPEPSVLGELELELGPTTGEFDPSTAAGVNGLGAHGEPDGMDAVWKDLEERADASGSGSGAGAAPTDPFDGMDLATRMRSRANSLEAVDRDANRFQAFGGQLDMAQQAAREVEMAAQQAQGAFGAPMILSDPVADGVGKGKAPTAKGKRKAEGAGGGGKKSKAAAAAAAAAVTADGTLPGGKKNRNPHSTQLPGNGQRRSKEEAGEGHEGPVCSHCESITTPLWRRGPDDELLCNACGLYLKLHGKARPKTFGKAGGSKRSSNGAAAQAAASGVPPSCSNCGATSTPMWRKDQEGRLCCNACSLYYKLHKVARPASLAQKRKAAAAAKANLAAAAAASGGSTAPEGSPDALPPIGAVQNQLPTPATSSENTPNGVVEGVNPQPPPLPPTLPAVPTFQLPPAIPQHQPSLPGMPAGHPYPPPMWALPPQLPPGFIPPTGFLPPGAPHLPPPGIPHQHPQQGGNYALPPTIPASPYAQTAWGALAYGIVSAAAAEEAGAGPPAPLGAGQMPPPSG
ncbi:hypothetical protein JCM10207_007980 [Rhodosporidiobolus poonsookiae]